MTKKRTVYYCNVFDCKKRSRQHGKCQRHLNKNPFSATNKKIDTAGKMRLICDIDDCTKRARNGFTKCFRHGGRQVGAKKIKLVSTVLTCKMKQIKLVPELTVSDRRDHKLAEFDKRIKGVRSVFTNRTSDIKHTDIDDVDDVHDVLDVPVMTEMQQQLARVKSRMALHDVITKDLNTRDRSMDRERAVQRMRASPFFSIANI